MTSTRVVYDLSNTTAIITGGAGGIGAATAIAMASAGANVVIADIAAGEAQEMVGKLENLGGDALFVETDVTDNDSVANLVTQTVERFGGVDFAVNNAGIELEWAPLADSSEAQFDKIVATNVKGVYLCMKHEILQMLRQKQGVIVNMASIAASTAAPNMSAYSASKHAVLGLTRTAAVEYATSGIRINAVSPGVVATEMTERALAKGGPELKTRVAAIHPMERIASAEEVAMATLWLCSDAASFTTGALIPVDGGRLAR